MDSSSFEKGSQLHQELEEIVGNDQILTESIDVLPYGFDGTASLKGRAACVVFPGNSKEVSRILKLSHREGFPVVARGSGTGLSGGSVPSAGSLVLCLNRLNRILETDPPNLTMLVETGVITAAVDEEAQKVGLFYPPDPGSMKISTIGGNVAENSGGLRGLKYGVTRDYVMGLEVVMADGTILWLGNKCVKDVAGYSLRDLFIGSEGTLGIITRVLLKLLPRPPHRQTLLATFNRIEDGAQTVSDIIARRIIPCTLEFLDQMTIQCVEDFARVGLPRDAKALVLMESDGDPQVVEKEAAAMEDLARKNDAINVTRAADEEEATRLAQARRSAFSALARIRPTTILEDVTVPRSHLARMVRFIAETGDRHQLKIATFGHLGDGNLHPTILTDETSAEEMERVEKAFTEIVHQTLEFGGTITGEHGIGLAKKDYLKDQLGDASLKLMRKIKSTLDPRNRLNPGKMI
ncbi:MAG: FAD-linked oxidase C-terminal domain-containing protein [Verrucomicrobiota bacterium]